MGKRISASEDYVPNIEIKDGNVLIDEKRFFDFPMKNKKHMKKLWK